MRHVSRHYEQTLDDLAETLRNPRRVYRLALSAADKALGDTIEFEAVLPEVAILHPDAPVIDLTYAREQKHMPDNPYYGHESP